MEPSLRDQLNCQKERSNDKDRYAIAVVDDGVVVGHLLRKISLVCSLCIKRGGIIVCKVTDRRRYSADLPGEAKKFHALSQSQGVLRV